MIESEAKVEMTDRLRRSAEMSANLEARMRHRVWDRARSLELEAEDPLEGLAEGPLEGLVEVRGEAGSKLMPSSIAPSRAEVQSIFDGSVIAAHPRISPRKMATRFASAAELQSRKLKCPGGARHAPGPAPKS